MWLAFLISNLGGLIQSVGAAWLMTSLTGSAGLVALVQASTALPIMLFSLAAGAIADNYDKRAVMLVAQVFTIAVSVVLAGCTYFGLITPWSLLIFTFLIGCGTAVNNPAWQSSVRDMVPRQDLPQAIALSGVSMNIARSVGPALGGVIVAIAGATAAFAVNAFSYLVLILVLFRWSPELQARRLPPESLGSAMGAGIRFVAMSPRIRMVLVRTFVFGLAGSAVQALMPLVARDLVGGGPATFGLLFGAFGIGAIGGGLSSNSHPSGTWHRGNGSSVLHRLCGLCSCDRLQFQHSLDDDRHGLGRSVLGPGSVVVQCRGPGLLAAVGGRADPGALSDGSVRRHRSGQRDLGSAGRAVQHQRSTCSVSSRSPAGRARRPAVGAAGRPGGQSGAAQPLEASQHQHGDPSTAAVLS